MDTINTHVSRDKNNSFALTFPSADAQDNQQKSNLQIF